MPSFNATKFFESVNREDWPELTDEEIQQLGAVLQHPTILKAFGVTTRNLMSARHLFLSLQMTSMEGIASAISLQGQIRGVSMFIEHLAALATRDSDEQAES